MPPEELERIIQDCQVPLPWQQPSSTALPHLPAASLQELQLHTAAHAGPARPARAPRRRGPSASASDLASSGEEEPLRASRRARRSSSEDSGEQWLPAGDAHMSTQPELAALLAAAGLASTAGQPVKPQPRAADAGSLEQLQQGLLPMSQGQQQQPAPQQQQLAGLFASARGPSPAPGLQATAACSDALPTLLAAFSAVPSGDRQQVAGLLQQLANVLQQQACSAATTALRNRMQAPPAPAAGGPAASVQQQREDALDVVRQLGQLCGGRTAPLVARPLPVAAAPPAAPAMHHLLSGLLNLGGSSSSGAVLSAPPASSELPNDLAEQLKTIQGLATMPSAAQRGAQAQTAAA